LLKGDVFGGEAVIAKLGPYSDKLCNMEFAHRLGLAGSAD
jgi:hypothetical protein